MWCDSVPRQEKFSTVRQTDLLLTGSLLPVASNPTWIRESGRQHRVASGRHRTRLTELSVSNCLRSARGCDILACGTILTKGLLLDRVRLYVKLEEFGI